MAKLFIILLAVTLTGCATPDEKWETGRLWQDANKCQIRAVVDEDGNFRVTVNGIDASEVRVFCGEVSE